MAGRKPAKIDAASVERAASIGCTVDEIAAVIGVGRRTLYDRIERDDDLKEALERGRDMGRATLRRLQWQTASDTTGRGAATMQIWLGKQMLGQKDHIDQSLAVRDERTPEQIRASIAEKAAMLGMGLGEPT